MSFAEKHPYLFWQLIGWGILLVSLATFVLGFLIALKLGGNPGETAGKA